jgi:hypothetical protein
LSFAWPSKNKEQVLPVRIWMIFVLAFIEEVPIVYKKNIFWAKFAPPCEIFYIVKIKNIYFCGIPVVPNFLFRSDRIYPLV